MTEQYYGGGNGIRRLSRAEIKKMKENMQKTPLVQEKSNSYHRLEEEKAEALLGSIINEEPIKNKENLENNVEKEEKKELGFFEKIKHYLFG